MKYKLAKELKDKGFPQTEGMYYRVGFTSFDMGVAQEVPWDIAEITLRTQPEVEHAYIPTLSELIEACGDGFDSLDRMVNFNNDETYGWATNLYSTQGGVTLYKTPEEAVAKLWIALQNNE